MSGHLLNQAYINPNLVVFFMDSFAMYVCGGRGMVELPLLSKTKLVRILL